MLSLMKQVKLFISHSERDGRFVEPLYLWLTNGLGLDKSEVRCTYVDGMDPGAVTVEKLRADLESSKAVVGLITTNSLSSTWAQFEMGAAWLQTRLHPIRGPGMRVEDLREPLKTINTPYYCNMSHMRTVIGQIAERMETKVCKEDSDEWLQKMCSLAEKTLKEDRKRWFTLAPLLSAWQLEKNETDARKRDRVRRSPLQKYFIGHIRRYSGRSTRKPKTMYSAAFEQLCEDLDLDPRKLRNCVRPSGLVVRDPVELPGWATDVWRVSQYVVNEMLDFEKESDQPAETLHALSTELIEKMHSALDHEKPKELVARDMQQWFEDAKRHIGENLPPEHADHSALSH